MITTQRVLIALSAVAFMACAKSNDATQPAKPAPGATVPTTGNNKQAAPPSTAPTDTAAPVNSKEPSQAEKDQISQTVRGTKPAPGTSVNPASQNQTKIPMGPVTPAKQDTKKAVGKVTSLGSAARQPEDFMNRGPDAAILDATFCRATGHFPNDGTQCYIVYDDGSTKYVNDETRADVDSFIADLKAQKDAQKKAKKPKTPKN